jgi:hypothetical protein
MKHLLFSFLLFLSVAARCQGGTYLPAVSSSTALIHPIAQRAQYIQADSVVIVYGSVFLNGAPQAGYPVSITISVPVPTNLAVDPYTLRGFAKVWQSGAPPLDAQVQNNSIAVQIRYTPTVSFPGNLIYNFSYIIH